MATMIPIHELLIQRPDDIQRLTMELFRGTWITATPDECWEHFGKLSGNAYRPFISIASRSLLASRVAWTLVYGPIPDGFVICHRCDNPRCSRPHHLFLGTQADNLADMRQKGRWRPAHSLTARQPAIQCRKGHAYTPDNVYVNGLGNRQCITCRRDAKRRWNAANRTRRVVSQ